MPSKPRSPFPPASAEVHRVTALASEGDGIARTAAGRVVFVVGGVPGDVVELADVREHKGTLRARIARIVEASPDRIAPGCALFGQCGGCLWQHVRYSAQLAAKRANVRAALERIGGLSVPGEVEIVESPDAYHYRARTRVVEVEGGVGYRRRGSNEVIRVEACPVLVPAAETVLARHGRAIGEAQAAVRRRGPGPRSSARAPRAAGSEREWIVTAGSQGEARVFPIQDSAGSAARSTPTHDPHAIAPPALELTVAGERLRVSGPGFVQGNALLWDRLALEVRERCLGPRLEQAPTRFLELYAGIGFLTLPLARAGLRGVAVESDRQAVADLAFNLERAGLAGAVTAVSSRVEDRRELAHWLAEADLLLVDPPRVGLEPRVREAIARGGPARVVYVSCDPATLARDLKELVGAGYRLASVVAFDLFPQTPHVETIVRLERRPA